MGMCSDNIRKPGAATVTAVATVASTQPPAGAERTSVSAVTSDSKWYGGKTQDRASLASQALELIASSPHHTLSLCEALVRMLSRGAGVKESHCSSITVAGQTFSSREELKVHCSQLLRSTKAGERFDPSNATFLQSLLEHHPRGQAKVRDAKAFTTGQKDGTKESHKCFVIIKANGQEETFSYLRCVDCVPSEEVLTQEVICELLVKILQLHPDVCEPVARLVSEKFPFHKGRKVEVEKHRNWVRSLLLLATAMPVLKEFLLVSLIRRMIEIDADIHKLEDVFLEEFIENKHIADLAQILDIYMLRLFEFLQRRLDTQLGHHQNIAGTEGPLVQTMLQIFDGHVLMTHRCRYVQFLYFYIASLSPAWTEAFLTLLLQHTYAAAQPVHKRLISMSYLASFVARAKFLTTKYTLRTTQYLSAFARERMQAAESYIASGELSHPQVVLFLASVQSVCYIVCWHADAFTAELLETGQSGLAALLAPTGSGQDVGAEAFTPVLESPCQPFGRIQPTIARQLLRVTKAQHPELGMKLRGQIAKHVAADRGRTFTWRQSDGTNGGSTAGAGDATKANEEDDDDEEHMAGLALFYPFDPYRLKHSEVFIRGQYRLYEETTEAERGDDTEDDASEATGGFHSGAADNPRIRAMSLLSTDTSESSDVDFVDTPEPSARGFIPSVGPSPAFRPQPFDMDLSPMIKHMEGVEEAVEEDSFSLPPPAEACRRCGNFWLDDEVFCRECGIQRPDTQAEQGTFMDTMLAGPGYGNF